MGSIEEREQEMRSDEREDWRAITLQRIQELCAVHPDPAIGYLVWTKHEEGKRRVFETIDALRARRIRHLRTGISWSEWIDPEGRDWIEWYMEQYAKHFEVLPCLSFTPERLSMRKEPPYVNSPPENFLLYGEFVRVVIESCGAHFTWIELWNEWNLDTDWDRSLDPDYKIFSAMVTLGADIAHGLGKRVILGGLSKLNDETLKDVERFAQAGLAKKFDAIAYHNLRGTWSDHSPAPPHRTFARLLQQAWRQGSPVWLTEYGFSVVETKLEDERRVRIEDMERIQVALFAYSVWCLISGTLQRVYCYTYRDAVHESLRKATTGWEDIIQFYYGDTDEQGNERLLARLLKEGGPAHVLAYAVTEDLLPLVDAASLKRKLE